MTAPLGLGDTSLFIAIESGRAVHGEPPQQISVSVITIGELRLGVLAAVDGPARARRLDTLTLAESLEPLPVDRDVASVWAALRLALRDTGRTARSVAHQRLAATALAYELPVVSHDADYDNVPGLDVIRV